MGWLAMSRFHMGGHETPKAYLDAQFNYTDDLPDGGTQGLRILASSCVNNKVWYAAAQVMKNDEPGEVFGLICLVRWNPKARSGEHFAYKDMCESMGPCEDECPERILNLLTPTDREHSIDWRARCRANIARRRRPVADGALVRFPNPLVCRGGQEETDFRVHKQGSKLRFFRSDGAGPYRVRDFYKLAWSILPETKVHRTVFARPNEPTKEMLKCA